MSSEEFLVFAGSRYYPVGGVEDYQGVRFTFKEAVEFGEQLLKDFENSGGGSWYQIVRKEDMQILDRQ